jgi:hypothetical protein
VEPSSSTDLFCTQVDKTELRAKKIDDNFAKVKAVILSDPSIEVVSDDHIN